MTDDPFDDEFEKPASMAGPTQEQLDEYGLAICYRCKRILTADNIERGRCKPGLDCGAHAMIKQALADGHPDSIELARGIERGLR